MFGEGTRGGHSDADWRRATQARQRLEKQVLELHREKQELDQKKRDTSKNSKKRLRFTYYLHAC